MLHQLRSRPDLRLWSLPAALLAAAVAASTAIAAPCPTGVGACGGAADATGANAYNLSPMVVVSPDIGSPCGMAAACGFNSTVMQLTVSWASTGVRLGDSTGGCIFTSMTGANVCKVGNNGLPVELLQFGVE